MKDDRLYLIHIRDCLARIQEYTRGGRQAFLASTLVQDAVIRNLQRLTESSQRLSSSLKSQHPKIDWHGMAGFRNVLVHDYLGINVIRVWRIVERDLPHFQRMMQPLLKGLAKQPSPKRRRSARSQGRKKKKK